MRGQFKDGTWRMKSEVQFYSGHANNECIAFNYRNKGGDYKTGVYWGGADYNSKYGYKYAGIKSYYLDKVKLITFAGCNTASEYDNITKRAHDYGVLTTVGWTKSIGSGSHSLWLKRYNDYLNKGYTVISAMKHADSFSYADNDVKKHHYYGNGNLRLTKRRENSNNNYTLNVDNKLVKVGKFKFVDKRDFFVKLKNVIEDYGTDNYYMQEIRNSEYTTINLNKKVREAISSSGYTVVITNNEFEVFKNDVSDEIDTIDGEHELNHRRADSLYHRLKLLSGNKQLNEKEAFRIIDKKQIYDEKSKKVFTYYRVESRLYNNTTKVLEVFK